MEENYDSEFSRHKIFIVFKHYYPDKYSYDYGLYDYVIIRKVEMSVYLKRDDEKYDDDNKIGFYIAHIDNYHNIHGNIAEVKAFTSQNREERNAMKGLGKFMLCTLTRYIVDVYDIDTNKVFYGEAVGGVPYFTEPIYRIYHPRMCELSRSTFNEIIYTTITESGRQIPPLLSEEELKFIVKNMLLLLPWDRQEELGPFIITDEDTELRKIVEILLSYPHKRLEFIKNVYFISFQKPGKI